VSLESHRFEGADRGRGPAELCEARPLEENGDEENGSRGASKGPAFLESFLKAERRVFAYIFTLHPHRADAEDILQQVSLLMWKKFDKDDPPRDFASWGCRIAYFVVMEHRRSLRRRGRRVVFSDELVERLGIESEHNAAALRFDDRQEALAACLEKLRRSDRALIEERFKDHATAQSAAESVGRSVAAVYKALARIRRSLHGCIERSLALEDGDDDR